MSYNPAPPDPTSPYLSPAGNVPASPLGPAEDDHRTPTPAIANLGFFVGVLVFLGFSIIAQLNNWGFFLTSTIGELGLALTGVFFCVMGRYSFKETFSIRRIDLLTIFLCLLVGFVGQFAVRFPTALNQWIMQVFGPFPVDDLFPNPTDLPGRLLFFFAVGLFGPVCEEVLNRGFVLAGYRRFSFWKTIFWVGLLFGLFHLYPFRFAYTFLLGMTLAYLVLITRSLWSAIAAHIGFNLLGALSPWIIDLVNQMMKDQGQQVVSGEGDIDFGALLATIPISLIGGGIFLLLMRGVTKRMAKRRPDLELGYLGIARNIRPELASGLAATGPYYGPNNRYTFGRYGYERSDAGNYLPANGFNPDFQAQNQPYPVESPNGSPYMTPQGFTPPVPPGYSPVNASITPPTPQPSLSPQSIRWWKISFILIGLLYFYTAATEISIRLNPAKTTPAPKTPSGQVLPQNEDSPAELRYISVK